MLFSSRWSLIGGLLIAISPGLAVFSNLLLAHHPTLFALSVFLWSFLKLMESNSRAAAIVSGIALAAAMLGRPMTAAGFALPFGVWLLVQWLRTLLRPSQEVDEPGVCLRSLLLVGTPLVAGFVILAIMNHKITGQWNRSAYQLYTDTWTPRHRFGFHNVEIGSQLAGPKVLESYDRWATDLTATKAAENVSNRIIASTQWTLGVGSLLFLLLAAIPSMMPRQRCDIRMTLIGCSVLSLHLVHIPYWYDGILHWHYVFETAPLLLILATSGLRNTAVVLQPLRTQWILRGWLAALGLASLIPNWVDAESLWGPSRVSLAVGEQSYSRVRFEMFRRMIHSPAVIQPSLILVDERQSDVQLSYIVNPPDLSGDSLVCRMPTSSAEISELAAAFPDRTFYRFDPQSFELQQLDRQNP
jgi:hypothetical protein